jgi:DNA topoisomerase-1
VAAPHVETKTARTRALRRAIVEVAHYLGNTPAVARASYIDPRIIDQFDNGVTIGPVLDALGDDADATAIQGPVEEAVLDLIANDRSSDFVAKVAKAVAA